MKILIVGGTRFIGPRIVDALLERGHNVTILNRGNTYGYSVPARVTRLTGDRNNSKDLQQLGAESYDYIYDMTCYGLSQARSLLKVIRPTAHIIFFSTAAVYKKPLTYPLTEQSKLGEWSSFGRYGTDKVEAESAFINFSKQHGLKVTIFRPVYLLGDTNYFDRENYYFSRIENGLPILVPGNGQALLQFAFADETAKAFTDIPFEQRTDVEILNVGGDDYISTDNLLSLCSDMAGKPAVICKIGNTIPSIEEDQFYEDLYPFPNLNLILSNKKIVANYGIKFMPLQEGLERIYKKWRSDWNGVVTIYPKEKAILEKMDAKS